MWFCMKASTAASASTRAGSKSNCPSWLDGPLRAGEARAVVDGVADDFVVDPVAHGGPARAGRMGSFESRHGCSRKRRRVCRAVSVLHCQPSQAARQRRADLAVVQWIERPPPKRQIQVRFLSAGPEHIAAMSRVEVVTENSLRVTPERILSLCGGRPRLFSIDGGHTAEATRNDLLLADRTACEGGLVILDDYFNSSWPAVSEGTCTFMREDRERLVPVAITSNKFIFTVGQEQAAAYRQRWLQNGTGPDMMTTSSPVTKVFGSEVISFEARPNLRDTAVHTQVLGGHSKYARWVRTEEIEAGGGRAGIRRLLGTSVIRDPGFRDDALFSDLLMCLPSIWLITAKRSASTFTRAWRNDRAAAAVTSEPLSD